MSLRLINPEVLIELKTNYFVETGTLSGDGIDYALELGFPNVISIDIYYEDNVFKRFSNNKSVKLIHGDSSLCLWDAVKDKDERLTFWLDSHADLIEHANNWNPQCPILEELAVLKKHHIKDHHILIDDITDIIKLPTISKVKLEAMLLDINPGYTISYADTGGTQTLIASTNGQDYNKNTQAYR